VERRFTRYIGIDYSGAQTPTASLKGLRIYFSAGFSVNRMISSATRMA
jgi:hypothetical protein